MPRGHRGSPTNIFEAVELQPRIFPEGSEAPAAPEHPREDTGGGGGLTAAHPTPVPVSTRASHGIEKLGNFRGGLTPRPEHEPSHRLKGEKLLFRRPDAPRRSVAEGAVRTACLVRVFGWER